MQFSSSDVYPKVAIEEAASVLEIAYSYPYKLPRGGDKSVTDEVDAMKVSASSKSDDKHARLRKSLLRVFLHERVCHSPTKETKYFFPEISELLTCFDSFLGISKQLVLKPVFFASSTGLLRASNEVLVMLHAQLEGSNLSPTALSHLLPCLSLRRHTGLSLFSGKTRWLYWRKILVDRRYQRESVAHGSCSRPPRWNYRYRLCPISRRSQRLFKPASVLSQAQRSLC